MFSFQLSSGGAGIPSAMVPRLSSVYPEAVANGPAISSIDQELFQDPGRLLEKGALGRAEAVQALGEGGRPPLPSLLHEAAPLGRRADPVARQVEIREAGWRCLCAGAAITNIGSCCR